MLIIQLFLQLKALESLPDYWEKSSKVKLNPNDPSDAMQDKDGDGYTNIEEYLNCLAGECDKNMPSPPKAK